MYKVIANEKAFADWLKKQKSVKNAIADSGAIANLQEQLHILDSCYGENRDIENDLGGYMVILYGKNDEVQNKYQQILHHHHLQEDEFEHEECYKSSFGNESTEIRLYLCSSDYAIIIVKIIDI